METVVLTIRDRTGAGKVTHEMRVPLRTDKVTVQDIIEARVIAEVDAYNAKLPEYFQGLVQPTDAESTLNGYKMKVRKKVDPEKQVYIALDAFQKNAYFVLIDNKQAEALDQEVHVKSSTTVSFLKLTPLVGG
ncbi:hypothetical protein KK083_10540 [Fulvivirgaceae bacterium PWU4]|uniref:Uncharacterized protein n=1 Tax=Chryseosolibacter histidini TaxID=2782349 RepID=A0AAP2DJ98_9BACT|nr:hypothetical protein [Chryseosolibacter histidini]MBT1697316.1 hypothetical protein [Chryseosolibacter histidini]